MERKQMTRRTKQVLVLMGLPAAGKSSAAFHQQCPDDVLSSSACTTSLEVSPQSLSSEFCIVHTDFETTMPQENRILHIEYDMLAEDLAAMKGTNDQQPDTSSSFDPEDLLAWRKSRKVALDRLQLALHDETIDTIIMDDNFHLRSMRKQVYQVCQTFQKANGVPTPKRNEQDVDQSSSTIVRNDVEITFGILWFDTPVDLCLQRNAERLPERRRVPSDVIIKMTKTLEPPSAWWEVHRRLSDLKDGTSGEVVDEGGSFNNGSPGAPPPSHIIQLNWLEPVRLPPPPIDPAILEAERRLTASNRIHQYDKMLRLWVGCVAKIDRTCTGKANQARKDMLVTLRADKDDNETTHDIMWVMESFLEKVGLSTFEKEQELVLRVREVIDKQHHPKT